MLAKKQKICYYYSTNKRERKQRPLQKKFKKSIDNPLELC